MAIFLARERPCSMLESLGVAAVLHCGDIDTAEVISMFSAWPTHFVFGNCDHDRKTLAQAIEGAGQTCHGSFGQLEIEGVRIAFLHGHDAELLRGTILDKRWDLVCHGHTHVVREERHGDTLVLNPGAVHRANPHTIATVELPAAGRQCRGDLTVAEFAKNSDMQGLPV